MSNDSKGSDKKVDRPVSTGGQEDRRKAVRKILLAGGGAVAAGQLASTKWAKPAIESVVLPAHAATSPLNPGFSINDPVSLTYSCAGSPAAVVVDITGYLDVAVAGIRVQLDLSWSGPAPTDTSPLPSFEVLTDANGNYSATGIDIGWGINSVTVVASLPDYPAAGTDTDTINPNIDNSTYYCLPPAS